MATRSKAYVDTSALIALVDRSDTYHPLFRRLFADPPALVTTPLVIAEGHGWFLRRYDSTRALQFLAMIEAMKPLKVVAIGARHQAGAIAILREFSDQRLTLTDGVGLYLMAERIASSCWSTDRHLGITDMMNKRILLLGLALTLMPFGLATAQEADSEAPAAAQEAEPEAKPDRYERRAGRRDRFYLNIGGVFLNHDTVDTLNARGFTKEGTVIDWEDVFGLPETTGSIRVEGHFKLFPRHRFRASFFRTNRAGDRVLIDKELNWGGIPIPIDVRINTSWDTRILRADYRYSLLQNSRVDVGVALGVYLLRVESSVGINETPIRTGISQSAPLPMLGADVEWDVSDHLVFKGGFQLFGVTIGDDTRFDGSWAEVRARLEWMPLRNVGVGVGYLYSRVDLDIEFAAGRIQNWKFKYNTGGVTAYALVSF